jgi:hypothetical protein
MLVSVVLEALLVSLLRMRVGVILSISPFNALLLMFWRLSFAFATYIRLVNCLFE